MPPRLFVDAPLRHDDLPLTLPPNATRHVQVLRLQPGDSLVLFDGHGGEWEAKVVAIARQAVQVQVLQHRAIERELSIAVTLALAMPANDRMDALVEKATELGATAIVPLIADRSVLRLAGERAERRQAHWHAIALAACEQCGRNRVPTIHAVRPLAAWFAGLARAVPAESRLMLGWREASPWPAAAARLGTAATLLSGPEGGFTDAEEDLARGHGFRTVSLGPRVLRADTAPIAALAALALLAP
jgi:16S rRNA (uracil1498-N3)-methyltransferase